MVVIEQQPHLPPPSTPAHQREVDKATLRFDGPSPEQAIALDIVKRAIPVAPIFVIVGALGWGFGGAVSAAYGMAIVLLNLVLSAGMLAYAARISVALIMGAALFGFMARLGLIFLAVLLVKDASWMELVPLGLTIIVTHLGLLAWEARYVSLSLASPGLKSGRPNPPTPSKEHKAS